MTDVLIGQKYFNRMNGFEGAYKMVRTLGNDYLDGYENDTLVDGAGNDVIIIRKN